MSERHPYPEREHLEPIHDLSDAIDYEIGMHAEGEEFRRGIAVIAGMYEGSAMHRTYLQLSRMMALSHAIAGHEQYKHTIDMDFLRGAMFALHCCLRVNDSYTRRQVTNTDMFPMQLDVETQTYKFESSEFRSHVTAMGEWAAKGGKDSFDQEPEAVQGAINRAAKHAYDDPSHQGLFIVGFMMAKDQTDYLTHYYSDKENAIINGMTTAV